MLSEIQLKPSKIPMKKVTSSFIPSLQKKIIIIIKRHQKNYLSNHRIGKTSFSSYWWQNFHDKNAKTFPLPSKLLGKDNWKSDKRMVFLRMIEFFYWWKAKVTRQKFNQPEIPHNEEICRFAVKSVSRKVDTVPISW